jgi:hypothetical protein
MSFVPSNYASIEQVQLLRRKDAPGAGTDRVEAMQLDNVSCVAWSFG